MKQWQRFSMPIGTTTSNWLFAAAGMVLAAAFVLFIFIIGNQVMDEQCNTCKQVYDIYVQTEMPVIISELSPHSLHCCCIVLFICL